MRLTGIVEKAGADTLATSPNDETTDKVALYRMALIILAAVLFALLLWGRKR